MSEKNERFHKESSAEDQQSGQAAKEKPQSSESALVDLMADLLDSDSLSQGDSQQQGDSYDEQPDYRTVSPSEPPWRRRLKRSPSRPQRRASFSSWEMEKLHQDITELEKKVEALEKSLETFPDLSGQVFPLLQEFLALKTEASRTALLNALIPLIDQAIAERSQQDRTALAKAIAASVAPAIEQQMKVAPNEVGSAIAPEVALAIKEQTRLQPEAMSEALGPEMGRAIKTQIDLERDAMVDALYPVIGDTIRKYMVQVVESINEKVEKALSPSGIRRKIRARLQGVSEAELILWESRPFQVQAVLLIQKASGLVIGEAKPRSTPYQLESEMMAGMLSAIRQFINDCVAEFGETPELNEIDYGDSRIILEVAGYCYLAVIIKGVPSQAYPAKMQKTLAAIVQRQGEAIQAYEGNPETIPDEIQSRLDTLLIPETDSEGDRPKKKFPIALLLLVLGLGSLVLIPLGVFWHRQRIASQIEEAVAIALEETPELSVYALRSDVTENTLTLTGRVPSESLRQQAAAIAQAAAPSDLNIDNQITAVNVPPPTEITAAEVQRIITAFNQHEGIRINGTYEEGRVNVTGVISDQSDAEAITAALQEIPGVTSVTTTWQLEPISLRGEISFDRDSATVNSDEFDRQLNPIAAILKRDPTLNLKIVGYSDLVGELPVKQKIAEARSQAVKQILMEQGISPDRLLTSALTPDSPSQANRIVRFEAFQSTSTFQ